MKKASLLFILILLGAAIVRLYKIDNPVADWHSWRQADTSAVSRIYAQDGIDLLHPRFEDISNIPSGKDNPQGYRFVEFPLYNAVVAVFFRLFPFLPVEIWGRVISSIASLASVWFIYALVKKYASKQAGLFAALFFGFVPFSVYYSRTILPDTATVTALLAGVYFFDRYLFEKKNNVVFYLLALIAISLAFLLKIYALFFTLPLVYLAYRKYKWKMLREWRLYIFTILALIPIIWWRVWMLQFPEGIPANSWLFNGNGIRFRPAFFRWILYERITKLLLGYVGVLILLFGSYNLFFLKEKGFFLSFVISAIIYVCTIATGNVQHDYYQILIMPSIVMVLGVGTDTLLMTLKQRTSSLVSQSIVGIIILVSFFFAWNQVKDYYNINHPEIVTAGIIADQVLPKDARVIAPYGGDTAFLYQINRSGWPSQTHDIPVLIEKGATHMVILNPDTWAKELSRQYPAIYQTDQLLILSLQK